MKHQHFFSPMLSALSSRISCLKNKCFWWHPLFLFYFVSTISCSVHTNIHCSITVKQPWPASTVFKQSLLTLYTLLIRHHDSLSKVFQVSVFSKSQTENSAFVNHSTWYLFLLLLTVSVANLHLSPESPSSVRVFYDDSDDKSDSTPLLLPFISIAFDYADLYACLTLE